MDWGRKATAVLASEAEVQEDHVARRLAWVMLELSWELLTVACEVM